MDELELSLLRQFIQGRLNKSPAQVRRTTPNALSEALLQQFDTGELPPVAPAPGFRFQRTPVGTDMARRLEQFLQLAPELRGQVGEITPGLNSNEIRQLLNQRLDRPDVTPEWLLNGPLPTNVLGRTAYPDMSIYVNPFSLRGEGGLSGTLLHELLHTVGTTHAPKGDADEHLWDKVEESGRRLGARERNQSAQAQDMIETLLRTTK